MEKKLQRDRIALRFGGRHRGHRLAGRGFYQRYVHHPHRRGGPRLHSSAQEQKHISRRSGHDGQHPPGYRPHPPRSHRGRRRSPARSDDRGPDQRGRAVPHRRRRRILGRLGFHRRHRRLQQGRFARTGPQGRRRNRQIPSPAGRLHRAAGRNDQGIPQHPPPLRAVGRGAEARRRRPQNRSFRRRSAGSNRGAGICSASGPRSRRARFRRA